MGTPLGGACPENAQTAAIISPFIWAGAHADFQGSRLPSKCKLLLTIRQPVLHSDKVGFGGRGHPHPPCPTRRAQAWPLPPVSRRRSSRMR